MFRIELRLFFVLISLMFLLCACGNADTTAGFTGSGDGDTESADGEGCVPTDRPTDSCPAGGTCGAFDWQWTGEPDCEWICARVPQHEGEACELSGGGVGVCQEGLCLPAGGDEDDPAEAETETEIDQEAESDPTCETPKDCLDETWDIRCVGHWSCNDGMCEETCDDEQCGNGTCSPGKGESKASCPADCGEPDYCEKDSDCPDGEICKNGICIEDESCDEVPPPNCVSDNPCVNSFARQKPAPECWTCVSENVANGTTCPGVADADGVCRDGECRFDVEPGDCSEVADCLGLVWMVNCIGHWSCQNDRCVPVCDFDGCGDGVCSPERGESEMSCGTDCAVITQCYEPVDCLSLSWNARCWGRWKCADGVCMEVCDYENCGDDSCDESSGESAMSCSNDCLNEQSCNVDGDCPPGFSCLQGRCTLEGEDCDSVPQPNCYNPGPCMEVNIRSIAYPECWACSYAALPDGTECATDEGTEGQCLNGLCETGTTPECNQPYDCLNHEWIVDCYGHWVCERGVCSEECSDELCGDGYCSPYQGESYSTCYPDCRTQGGDRTCSEDIPCLVSDVDCGCYGTLPTGEDSCMSTLPIQCECMGGRCGCPDGSCVDANASWLKILAYKEGGVVVPEVNITILTSTSSGNDREIYRTVTGENGTARVFIGSGAYRVIANKAISPIETLWGEGSVYVTSAQDESVEIVLQSVW